MSKRSDGQAWGKYTLEFKLEAVRLVKGGQAASVTAKVLGIPKQTLDNWIGFGSVKKASSRAQATSRCRRNKWNWPGCGHNWRV